VREAAEWCLESLATEIDELRLRYADEVVGCAREPIFSVDKGVPER